MSNKPYEGGRCLRAAFLNKNLSTAERLVLVTFASDLNFKGNFQEKRYMSLSRWSSYTGISERNMKRVIKSLEHRGYLQVYRENGKVNYYSLTQKIFDEYSSSDPVTEDTMAPVDITGDTMSPPTQDTMSPVNEITGDTMSPPVSILKNSLIEETPSVCENSLAPARAYDQSHTHIESVDVLIDIYFSNETRRNNYKSKKSMGVIFTKIMNQYGREEVIGLLDEIHAANGYQDMPWDPATITQMLADRREATNGKISFQGVIDENA